MFGKTGEAEKVVALRRAAMAAMHGDPPLVESIALTLIVHVGAVNVRATGDLDNFVTGVCDSLMAALPSARIAPIFDRPENLPIHPSKVISIADDIQVVEIQARKVIGDADAPWYEVTLEGV